jgi:hypothetical protein
MSAAAGGPPAVVVGVTGHRHFGDDPRAPWYVHAECVRILDRLRELARYRGAHLEACSALAAGADQLFAQAAVGLGIPLVAVVPFDDYPLDFEGEDRARYEALLALCDRVHRLPRKRRSEEGYLAAGKWIADRADYLVAVWNGLPAAGKGGTGDIVRYASTRRCIVLRIDPAALPS